MHVEPSFHPRDESHLVVVCDPLSVHLRLVCNILLRVFAPLHPSGTLACGSFIPVVSLSGFDIRVILASYNESGSVPSSSMFWKSLREGLKSLFKCVVEVASDAACSLAVLCWEVLIPESISLFVIGLFRFSVPSCLRKVGRLYVSNNLCISPKLSTFWVYNCGLFVFL